MTNYFGQYFDADAHVREGEGVWDELEEPFRARRPVVISLDEGKVPARGRMNAFWLIEGKAIPNPIGAGQTIVGPSATRHNQNKPYRAGSQELTDAEQRLTEMDAAGIQIQVLFPSLLAFNVGRQLTPDRDFESAIIRAYNSFMAKACGANPNRLKWTAVMPMNDVAAAVREVERTKALGAIAVVIYGAAGDRMLYDRDFDPFWQACAEAAMPVCVHLARAYTPLAEVVDYQYAGAILASQMTVPMGFFGIVGGGVLDRFPTLRFLFLEAGCQWIPFMVGQMSHYQKAYRDNGYPFDVRLPERDIADYLASGCIYVTAEADDALINHVAAMIGEDNFLFSSDMPHGEGRDDAAQEYLDRADLSAEFKHKILVENGPRFYGLA